VSVSYFVRYEGEASEEFLRYYREHHVPILARWPGMRRVVLHTVLPFKDRFEVSQGKASLLAQLEFETRADLDAALASAQRAEARRDFEKFPSFGGQVFHQAMASEEVWRKP
jgi:uncharacterized protein (TIGR02118 family)